MSPSVRIGLANVRFPSTPEASVRLATSAVADAAQQGASVVCFPEAFVPGYRWPGATAPPPDALFLEHARAEVAAAARAAGITVLLGIERVTDRGLQISVCVINADGSVQGWQDKAQLDPAEERIYPARALERRVFTAGPLTPLLPTVWCGGDPRGGSGPGRCHRVSRPSLRDIAAVVATVVAREPRRAGRSGAVPTLSG